MFHGRVLGEKQKITYKFMRNVLQFNGQEQFGNRMNRMMIAKVTCSMCAALELFCTHSKHLQAGVPTMFW